MNGRTRKEHYKLLQAEPGILIELFLPKKGRFQGELHESLKTGADFSAVGRHFRTKKKYKLRQIKKVLSFYEIYQSFGSSDIEALRGIFQGFSMYEVDGVFYSSKKRKNNAPMEYEERTQIIKLMFVPQYASGSSISEKVQAARKYQLAIARAFLPIFSQNYRMDKTFSPTDYEKAVTKEVHKRLSQALDKKDLRPHEKEYVLYLIQWVHSVGLWVFGYVVYRVLERIRRLPFVPEEEIWVTSQFDFLVNKLKLY